MINNFDIIIYAINAIVICISLSTADNNSKINRLNYFSAFVFLSLFYTIGFIFKESNNFLFYIILFSVSYFNYKYDIYRIRDCGWSDKVILLFFVIPIIPLIRFVLILNKGKEVLIKEEDEAELKILNENKNFNDNIISNQNDLNQIKITHVTESDPFEYASIFYPIIKIQYNYLHLIDEKLAFNFKNELIKNKSFVESEVIYDEYLLKFITTNIINPDAILYAKILLENNDIPKLKKLIEVSNLLGKSFDLELFLKKT